jgi:hypothetical protein
MAANLALHSDASKSAAPVSVVRWTTRRIVLIGVVRKMMSVSCQIQLTL